MLVKTDLPARLGSFLVTFALAATVTLAVCPALASSAANDAHRHCKTSGGKAPAPDDSGCRLKCASASAPAVISAGFSGVAVSDDPWGGASEHGLPQPSLGATPAPIPHTTGPPSPRSQRNAVLLI